MLELELAVDGDRVVDRLKDRPALLLQLEQAPTQCLVVVYEVELVAAVPEMAPCPQTEGHGFREVAGAERDVLGDVGPVLPLPDPWLAHGVRVAPDVEAGQFDERDALVEDGIGGAAQHLDVVSEVDEGFAQVADIDALSSHMGLSAIGQQCDAKGAATRILRLGHGSTHFRGRYSDPE